MCSINSTLGGSPRGYRDTGTWHIFTTTWNIFPVFNIAMLINNDDNKKKQKKSKQHKNNTKNKTKQKRTKQNKNTKHKNGDVKWYLWQRLSNNDDNDKKKKT